MVSQQLIEHAKASARRAALSRPPTDRDLRYAARIRCRCGAGMAYRIDDMAAKKWDCSYALKLGIEDPRHDEYLFGFYEIKGEDHPSAHGRTTRPGGSR